MALTPRIQRPGWKSRSWMPWDFNEFELEADWEALDQDIAENMAAD